MSKILAVFGATGQQGSSVVNYVLNDPKLAQEYKVRAVTRDPNSDKAKKLKESVEVVQGNVLDRASLETALAGVHTVFAMTAPAFGPDGFEVEYTSGKNISDVSVKMGAEYVIWSTLPHVKELSGGKYTKVAAFDAKADIEKHIRSLPIKSSFVSLGSFMENLVVPFVLNLQQGPDGTWIATRHISPKSPIPLIDAVGDTGKFVGAILAEPDKYEGKTFCAAQALYNMEEIVTAISKATGKTVVYEQISVEEFKKNWPFKGSFADLFAEGFSAWEEFGYYGPDTDKLVAWAAENARGRLTTLEEYLEAHPLQLG